MAARRRTVVSLEDLPGRPSTGQVLACLLALAVVLGLVLIALLDRVGT